MKIVQHFVKCEKKLRDMACSFFDADEDIEIVTVFKENDKEYYAYCEIKKDKKIYPGEYKYKNNTYEAKVYKNKYIESAILKAFCICALQIKKVKLPWGVMCGVRPAKNIRTFAEGGYNKEQIKELFREIYLVNPEKFELAYEVYENEKKFIAKKGDKGIGVYIGIPFCPTRCRYCSFVSTDMRYSGKYEDDFCKKLCEEIKITADIIKDCDKFIKSIYIGGGTPTSLKAENIELILKAVSENFDLSKAVEFTLEAGRADTITKEKLSIAKKYGVDRISINPQTMKNETLERINRGAKKEDIYNAFRIANEIGFKSINADLIAGLPGEGFLDFEESLEKVIRLYPQNITVHTMCVKRGSDIKLSKLNNSSAMEVGEMVEYSRRRLKETGYIPYYMYRQKYMIGNFENVGYAKPGFESDYNINIMEENQTIIALGGGASSKIVTENGIERVFNFKDPVEYINNFEEIVNRKEKIKKIINGENE